MMRKDSKACVADHRGLAGSALVHEDLKSAERDELVKKHGYKAMDYHE